MEMSKKQKEVLIAERCKAWWEMTIETDWEDVVSKRGILVPYIEYFLELNKMYVYKHNKSAWVQIYTILNEMLVCLDVEDEMEELFLRCNECFDMLWVNIELYMEYGDV